MKLNSIMHLENDKNYLILKAFKYSKKEYYLAFAVDNNKKINPNDLIFLTTEEEGQEQYINIVEDKKILKELIRL